jgi:hypothetical protein
LPDGYELSHELSLLVGFKDERQLPLLDGDSFIVGYDVEVASKYPHAGVVYEEG